jgi:hypothetical protein
MEENKETISKDLFQDLTPEQRLQSLRDNAYASEETVVTRRYTKEEKQKFKEDLAYAKTEADQLNEELDNVKKQYKAKLKPHEQQIKEASAALRKGYSENREEVFLMDNQHDGVMEIYDGNGKFLSSRRLYENERQTKIVSMERNGTQG